MPDGVRLLLWLDMEMGEAIGGSSTARCAPAASRPGRGGSRGGGVRWEEWPCGAACTAAGAGPCMGEQGRWGQEGHVLF
jgi:hypothetical protein